MSTVKPVPHGTRGRYVYHGCRCEWCRAANAANAAYQRSSGGNVRRGARAAAKRRWDHENRPTCACGNLMSRHSTLCVACSHAAKREALNAKRGRIKNLWDQGRTLREIAESIGTTPGTIGAEITRMRSDGWDLPFRRPRVAA